MVCCNGEFDKWVLVFISNGCEGMWFKLFDV